MPLTLISTGKNGSLVVSNQNNKFGGLSLVTAPIPLVTSGLTLQLDAGNSTSYPGSGTTWTDLAGTQQNITLVNSPTIS